MKTAVYARYSSENQRAASIEDQLEICRRFIERQGWVLAQVYEDRSMSGASRFRPGYQQMVADLASGTFEVIVVEALDRLGRKLADVAELHDRLVFAGIKLYAVSTGEITAMHIGMLGTMAQLFLADLRGKDLARPARSGAAGQAPRRHSLWLRRDRADKGWRRRR
jgi:DNA invertase Pin-like site-specific DNA recombinase